MPGWYPIVGEQVGRAHPGEFRRASGRPIGMPMSPRWYIDTPVGGKVELAELYQQLSFSLQVWFVEGECFYNQAVWCAGVECLDVSRVDLFRRTIAAEEAYRLEHVLCEVWAVADDRSDVLAQEIAAAGCDGGFVVYNGPRDWKKAFCTVGVNVNLIFDGRLR